MGWGAVAAEHSIGKLKSVASGGYQEAYTYDNRGRPLTHSVTIPSDATHVYEFGYHPTTGLLDTLTYPVSTSSYRLKLQYVYQNNLLRKVSDFNAPSTDFWRADETNPRGQVTKETLGNGVVTNRDFDAVTGWLDKVLSGVGGGNFLQNQSYLYDQVGNVTERQNNNLGLTEDFWYDDLHRLDYSTLNGLTNLDLSYDLTGNITSRSDVAGGAAWTYHPTKKHAVTQAGNAANTYSYDARGNAISRNGYLIQWSSYDHPLEINGAGGEKVEFSYTHRHERWRAKLTRGDGSIETTYFVGELLEKVLNAGVTDYRHYIVAGESKIAVYSRPSTGPDTLSYIREDHQGSVSSLLKSDGTPYVSESFTAFGNRRSACTWTGSVTNGNLAKINATTRRGYTWHTALGAMGLNDMNGRIQDAVTGRFLSPDPYVFEPEYTQAYNRYSYVYNNPLSFTDPTGFEAGRRNLFQIEGGAAGLINSAAGQYQGPIIPRIREQPDDVLRALANHVPEPASPDTPIKVPMPSTVTVRDNAILDTIAAPWGGWEGFEDALSCVVNCEGPVDVEVAMSAFGPVQAAAVGPVRLLGGAYSKLKPVAGWVRHHMPANASSPLSLSKGPSILMEAVDHVRTSSWGSSAKAAAYRQAIQQLLQQGRWRDAMAKEIRDVRRIAGRKYNQAVQEMLAYMRAEGLID